jgi:pimeloyl-ACP methyl ester carboxylesterase
MNRINSIALLALCLVFGMVTLALSAEAGARPNVAVKTLGGMQLWEDLKIHGGWRIQRNVVSGHFRLLDDKDIRRAWGSRQECVAELVKARRVLDLEPKSQKAVVLLHGLGRTKGMFNSLEKRLKREGYEVVVVNYPSTRRTIAAHTAQIEEVLLGLEGVSEVSFITHSLGGIVMRDVLARRAAWSKSLEPRRLVMMGPPNRGSALARDIPEWTAEPIMGISALELRRVDLDDYPAPKIEFGIIAGGRGEEGFNPLIAGNDDGVVGVSETHLSGASDFMIVDGLHSFLPSNPLAIEASVRFLETGAF